MGAKMAASNKENGGWQQLQVWLLLFWPGCGSLLMINSYDPHWRGAEGWRAGVTGVKKCASCQHTRECVCVWKEEAHTRIATHTHGEDSCIRRKLWQHSVPSHADGPTKPITHTHTHFQVSYKRLSILSMPGPTTTCSWQKFSLAADNEMQTNHCAKTSQHGGKECRFMGAKWKYYQNYDFAGARTWVVGCSEGFKIFPQPSQAPNALVYWLSFWVARVAKIKFHSICTAHSVSLGEM